MAGVRGVAAVAITLAVALVLTAAPAWTGGEEMAGPAAFERLKALEGSWSGSAAAHEGGEEAGAVRHEFRVSANGSVVMETMNPGTEHEMINMYHLDGDHLVLTHYCAGANQPRMRLAAASADEMVFEFTGGSNLNVAEDMHIHGAKIVFKSDDALDSMWTGWAGGEEAGTQVFSLSRVAE